MRLQWGLIFAIMLLHGDARSRRERLVPDCEPRGTDLVKSVQNNKCQSHKLRYSSSRCISEQEKWLTSKAEVTSPTTVRLAGSGKDVIKARMPITTP